MSITLDDNAIDGFKLYDELATSYAKDIDDYKAIVKAIEAMIAQKEKMLQDIKNKTIHLIKNSIQPAGILPAQKASKHQSVKKYNYAGVDEEDLKPDENITLINAVVGMPGVIPEKANSQRKSGRKQKATSGRTHQKKAGETGKGKIKKAGKLKKTPLRINKKSEGSNSDQPETSSKKTLTVKSTALDTELKCLYHPEAIASDMGRQLCSSCKWKLINSGLTKFDKEPVVISFLKGEITKFPDLGQSMCPVHPEVPSYNKKTGLCKVCQKKAKGIGIEDRRLTEDELIILRNPAL